MAPGKAYTDHQFHSNSYTGPRPTPTIPKGGLFSLYASTTIPTPPQFPYAALLDLRHWSEWSTTIPHVLITKHPSPHSRVLQMEVGTYMTLTHQLTPTEKSETKEVVRHLEALKTREKGNSTTGRWVTRIRWTMDNAGVLAPGFMLRTERVLEIEEKEDGTTEVRHWQSYAGLGAKVVRRKWEAVLREQFVEFLRDLRRRSAVLERRERNGEEEGESSVDVDVDKEKSAVQGVARDAAMVGGGGGGGVGVTA